VSQVLHHFVGVRFSMRFKTFPSLRSLSFAYFVFFRTAAFVHIRLIFSEHAAVKVGIRSRLAGTEFAFLTGLRSTGRAADSQCGFALSLVFHRSIVHRSPGKVLVNCDQVGSVQF
jgi:hypothetical protein